MKTIGNNLAFTNYVTHDENGYVGGGLTKRELFAALILQGLCANSANMDNSTGSDARVAVNAADQLIKALNEKGEE